MSEIHSENVINLFKKNTKERLAEVHVQFINLQKETKIKLDETEAEMESATKELYNKIVKLQEEAEKIEAPYKKKIEGYRGRGCEIEGQVNVTRKALRLHEAKDLLQKGIETKDDFARYLEAILDLRVAKKAEDIREVKHSRGKDIHVWSWKTYYGENVAYLALTKGKVLAGLTSEKAKYIGDYTTNHEYGCKVADDIKEKSKYRSSYRTGACLHEWLDPDLVKWTGLSDKEQIEFWNRID